MPALETQATPHPVAPPPQPGPHRFSATRICSNRRAACTRVSSSGAWSRCSSRSRPPSRRIASHRPCYPWPMAGRQPGLLLQAGNTQLGWLKACTLPACFSAESACCSSGSARSRASCTSVLSPGDTARACGRPPTIGSPAPPSGPGTAGCSASGPWARCSGESAELV